MYTREKPMRRPRRMTHNQALVLEVLRTEGRAMTAYQILDVLRDHGLRAPVQMYRAMASLLEREEADRIESLHALVARSEERRVGQEGGSTCTFRWHAWHYKKTK